MPVVTDVDCWKFLPEYRYCHDSTWFYQLLLIIRKWNVIYLPMYIEPIPSAIDNAATTTITTRSTFFQWTNFWIKKGDIFTAFLHLPFWWCNACQQNIDIVIACIKVPVERCRHCVLYMGEGPANRIRHVF